MKKLQILLLSAALACGAFAQEKTNKDAVCEEAAPAVKAIMEEKNDENFPKEITDKLSPAMKKIKNEIWGCAHVVKAQGDNMAIGYANALLFFGDYPDGSLWLGVFFRVPGGLENRALEIADFLNKESLVDADFRHFKNMPSWDEDFTEIRAFIIIPNAEKMLDSGGFKKYFEIQKRYADWATSYAALFEAGFCGGDPSSIMNKQRYANLPLKFLRIISPGNLVYNIQYAADGRHIFFVETRSAAEFPKDLFQAKLEFIKEGKEAQNIKNLKTGETSIGGVKYKTISYELLDIKRIECFYISDSIMFETSTLFPRAPEAQKIIEEMIEKRAADKMPTLPEQEDAAEKKAPENAPEPQAQAHAQGEKAPQAPKVSE